MIRTLYRHVSSTWTADKNEKRRKKVLQNQDIWELDKKNLFSCCLKRIFWGIFMKNVKNSIEYPLFDEVSFFSKRSKRSLNDFLMTRRVWMKNFVSQFKKRQNRRISNSFKFSWIEFFWALVYFSRAKSGPSLPPLKRYATFEWPLSS